MNKIIKINWERFVKLIFTLLGLSINFACESYNVEHKVHDTVARRFSAFASSSDSIKINRIDIGLTDKRFYSGIEHCYLYVDYQINIENTTSNAMDIVLRDSTYRSKCIATYKADTVAWVALPDEYILSIPPESYKEVLISNYCPFGACYIWESLFSDQLDYETDILNILPDIKVYYDELLILPDKDVEIWVTNYKDGWLDGKLFELFGEPYHWQTLIHYWNL